MEQEIPTLKQKYLSEDGIDVTQVGGNSALKKNAFLQLWQANMPPNNTQGFYPNRK